MRGFVWLRRENKIVNIARIPVVIFSSCQDNDLLKLKGIPQTSYMKV